MPPGAVTAMHQKATGARKQFTWLSRKLKGRGKIPTVLHEAMHFVSDYQSLGNNSILASALDRYVSNARLHKMVPTLEAPLYAVSEASDPAILKWLRKSRETENLPEYEPIIKRHDNTVSSFKECGDLVGDALHAIDRVSGKPLAGLTALRIVLLDPHLDFMMALGEIERGDRDGWIEETKQIVSEELRRGREKQFEKKK